MTASGAAPVRDPHTLCRLLEDSQDRLKAVEAAIASTSRGLAEQEMRVGVLERCAEAREELRGISNGRAAERLSALERAVGEQALEQRDKLQQACDRIDALDSRICETGSRLPPARTLQDRMEHLERAFCDATTRRSQELLAADAKLEQACSRLDECERLCARLGAPAPGLAGALSTARPTVGLTDRVELLEKALRQEVAGSQVKDSGGLSAVRSRQAGLEERLSGLESAIGGAAELERAHKRSDQHHASLRERLSVMEATLGGAVDKQTAGLTAMQASIGQVLTRLAACEQAEDLRSAADGQARALSAARKKLDQMHGSLIAREEQSGLLELQRSVAGFAKDREALGTQVASLREHVGRVEKAQLDLVQEHARGFHDLRAVRAELAEGRGAIAVEAGDRERGFASLQERVCLLEAAARDAAARHQAQCGSLADQLGLVEHAARSSAEQWSDELGRALAGFEQLWGRLEEEDGERDEHRRAMDGLRREQAALSGRCAALEEERLRLAGTRGADETAATLGRRLDAAELRLRDLAEGGPGAAAAAEGTARLQRALRDLSDRSLQELEEVQAAHERYAESLRGSAEQQARAWTSMRAEVDGVQGRLEALACLREEVERLGGRTLELEDALATTHLVAETRGAAAAPLQALANAQAKLDRLDGILREDRGLVEAHLRDVAERVAALERARAEEEPWPWPQECGSPLEDGGSQLQAVLRQLLDKAVASRAEAAAEVARAALEASPPP